CMQGIEFPFTF
nr:immunoglobulin light chain junction region [Macaca mulatta]